ncbi:hypothetical protein K2P96_01745 [Patescibacteria group bacterium]|nr:hypothetical protein [Patescibacteria group bacterium]
MKNKNLGLLISIIFVIFLGWLLVHDSKVTNAPAPTDQTMPAGQNTVVVGIGERCGGNMMNAPVCDDTAHCAPVPGSNLPFGDVGGICVSN